MNITYNTLKCLTCTRQLTIPHTITINSSYFQHCYPRHVPGCHKQYMWQIDLQSTPFPDLNSPYKRLHTCTSDSDIREVPVSPWLVTDQPSLHPYNFVVKFWLKKEIKTKFLNYTKIFLQCTSKVTTVHSMTAYGEVEVSLHSFLTPALKGGEQSASSLDRFTPWERTHRYHWLGGWVVPVSVSAFWRREKSPTSARN